MVRVELSPGCPNLDGSSQDAEVGSPAMDGFCKKTEATSFTHRAHVPSTLFLMKSIIAVSLHAQLSCRFSGIMPPFLPATFKCQRPENGIGLNMLRKWKEQ
ncbi:hypothetical protein T265_04208 [Opisthorchis viverrini]|uniref:Uncharacterized protein n=1 Tax=Opisthorchis viverrini TaxID=6198 RepID=A0A075AGW3_OPIVI|nr:hypothetical protein T265_04208 [Opisthorchis viverrini]KER29124.1 hypothetical protein T265_04208 [Opisthorchis viverrini]